MPFLTHPHVKRELRSGCPIAAALDIIGDRWSLVILRDILSGKARFGEFLVSPEGIATSVLADRLEHLEAAGLIARTPYQQRPRRFDYGLTEKGLALVPILQEIGRWGNRFIPHTEAAPASVTERTLDQYRLPERCDAAGVRALPCRCRA